eukprot:CAMPEP_0114265790 /NCGR_PEP_ID=MMETSP0058-20121206/24167_1 /TAXON_ID=36894 /ORGANISM="Pyramimonas parkeae, CCMP726" /LENGTH=201 /DNA_ID=CAMNT_0001383033 /DNA_START=283 /DNA_END=885 /DNA_ORIENTATION=-
MYDFAAESMLAQLAASAVEAKEEDAAAVINVLHRAVEYVCQTEAHAAFQGRSIMPQLEEHQERCWRQSFEEKRKGQGKRSSSLRSKRSSARPPTLAHLGPRASQQLNSQNRSPKHQQHQLIKPSTYAPLLPSPPAAEQPSRMHIQVHQRNVSHPFSAMSPAGSDSGSTCKLWVLDEHSLASSGSTAGSRGGAGSPRARVAS